MVEGFKQILEEMPMKPHRIFTDKGKEFRNKLLMDLFKKEEIEKYESTHSAMKAALAERAIRNIKQRCYRFFSQHETLNWFDNIQLIVDGINRSPCRVLPGGMRPIDVNFKNSQQIWQQNYGKEMYRSLFTKRRKGPKPKFVKDQTVRMSTSKNQFEKGYIPNYGDEILVSFY